MEFADYQLFPHERLLVKNDSRVALTPRILDLLIVLVEHEGELVSKEELLNTIWADSFVEEGNISRAVSTLRKNLGVQPNGSDFIETVPKLGYRFIAPVSENIHGTTAPSGPKRPIAKSKRFVLAVIAILLVVATVGTAIYLGRRGSPVENNVVPKTDPYEAVRLTSDPRQETIPRWTSDGRIRFWRVDEKTRQAESLIMNADGTDATKVRDSIETWSPDGKRVIFARTGEDVGPFLANADGSNEVALPFLRSNFSWSADSKRLVYQMQIADKNNDIFVYTLETGKHVNVTNNPSFDADPSFSPDGKEILFASGRDGNAEIYIMQADGSNVRRLTNNPAWDNHPVFSPDGTQIAFPSDRDDENSNVFIMNADGSGVRRLTDWPASETVEPGCWSPDGTKIAFFSDREGNDDIYVINAEAFQPKIVISDETCNLGYATYSPDGRTIAYQSQTADKSGELRVFELASQQSHLLVKTKNADVAPRFSPDGRTIIFQNKVVSDTEIFSIDVDGGSLRNLTNNQARDGSAAFSPDGKHIVFSTNRDGNTGKYNLYQMNSDGSGQRQIYASPLGMSGSAVWTPDGKSLIFANDFAEDGNFEIFRMNVSGSITATRLTDRRRIDDSPAISADGRKITFASNTDGNFEIYIMNIDGTGLLRLTRNFAADGSPSFSPDGKTIIFSSDRDGKNAIYEINLSQ